MSMPALSQVRLFRIRARLTESGKLNRFRATTRTGRSRLGMPYRSILTLSDHPVCRRFKAVLAPLSEKSCHSACDPIPVIWQSIRMAGKCSEV